MTSPLIDLGSLPAQLLCALLVAALFIPACRAALGLIQLIIGNTGVSLLRAGVGCLLALLAISQISCAQEHNSFAIRQVDLFDGTAVRRAQDVIVRDGLIEAVGPHLTLPAGLAVHDGQGRMLLPGLIDAHVHSFGGNSRSDALRFGVTTELDMFMDWHALAGARAQRETLAMTAQADLWSAGTLATVPGGHGTEYGMDIPALTSAGQAQAWVDARLKEGSDYIKIVLEPGSEAHPLPTLSPEEAVALIQAAHHDRKMAIFHVQHLKDARVAVAGGADGLAHVFFDQEADADMLRLLRRRHLFVIPTLSVIAGLSCGPEAASLLKDPAIAPFLSGSQAGMLGRGQGSCSSTALATALSNTRRLHEAGVPLLAGTDAGNLATAHGASLLGEIELLEQAGLSPLEALAAATSQPAQRFGLKDRGRIAAGARADLVLFEGDPTVSPASIRHVAAVWKNGYPVDRKPQAAPKVFAGQFSVVQGPLAATDPGASLAGQLTVVPGAPSGEVAATLGGGEVFKGTWQLAQPAVSGDPSQDWDAAFGPGYFQDNVQKSPFHVRAALAGSAGSSGSIELAMEHGKLVGVARDSKGNLFKVSF